MAWNEPNGSNNRDPWGQGGNHSAGPPDLDEVIRQLQQRFSRLFNPKKGGSEEGGDGNNASSESRIKWFHVVLLLGLLWIGSGLYIVDEGYRAVIRQFGSYTKTTEPGLNWHLPLVQSIEQVDVSSVRTAKLGYKADESLMLTQDENIIDIKFDVQYQIKSTADGARDYLFNVRDPDETLLQATASAVREVIGKSPMDFVLTEGRSMVTVHAQQVLQDTLDLYKTGLNVIQVTMQNAQAPMQVKKAFDDVVEAREDSVRFTNEAETYANDILPKARGRAARVQAEANAYREQVVAEAEGRSSRFTQILNQYQLAPEIMRKRLYLDAMEGVLKSSSKVLIDVKNGNNLIYLPLDQLRRSTPNSLTLPQSLEQLGENDLTNTTQPPKRAANEESLRNGQRRRESR